MPFKETILLFSPNAFPSVLIILILMMLISFSSGCSSSLAARADKNNSGAEAANKKIETKTETEVPLPPVEIADKKLVENGRDSPSKQAALILYDFRSQPAVPPLQKISKTEENIVWKYVYGANRKMDIGEFVDHRFTGAFTAPGAQETLYVVKGNKGGDDPATETTFAVYNGTIPVGKFKAFGSSVLKVTDLNGDGKNELFLNIGDISNGSADCDAAIVQIDGGQIETIKKFPNVFSSVDSFDHRQTGAEVALISYAPGAAGEFPVKYSIAKFSCTGAEGEVNPKTCRPAKSR